MFDDQRLVDPKLIAGARTKLDDLFALTTQRKIRVTKIDIAIDYDAPIWGFQALGSTSRRFRCLPFLGRVRTLESGSRRSPFSLSAYDKRYQLRRVHEIEIGHELMRIEARVKPRVRLSDLATLTNPFDAVSTHLLEPQRDARVGLKLFVRLARIVGLTRLRAVLPDELYDDLLAETALAPHTWPLHPLHVFAEQWPRVVTKFSARLGAR